MAGGDQSGVAMGWVWRHLGNVLQPQKGLPAFAPERAVRWMSGAPQRGQDEATGPDADAERMAEGDAGVASGEWGGGLIIATTDRV